MPPSWDDDAFAGDSGSDPFGVSGDVFGRDLGDVDPFQGNDSFDGDAEWDQFNPDDDNDERGTASSSRRRPGTTATTSTRTSTSSSRDPHSPKKKKGRKPGASSRKLVPSAAAKAPTSPGSTRTGRSGRSRGDDNDDDDDRGRRNNRSRSKSRTRGGSSRSSSRGPGDREATSPRPGKYRGSTKASYRERHSGGAPKSPTGFDTTGAFGGDTSAADDPFGIGASAAGGPVDDAFVTDFAAFPSSNNNDDGFGAFADFGDTTNSAFPTEKRPPRPSRGSAPPPRQASIDEEHASRNQAKPFRRGSSASSVTSGGAGSNTSRFRHSRSRNAGMSSRLRPSEFASKQNESNERRSAIKDSLFGALGDEDEANGEVSLDNFFGESKKKDRTIRRASDAGSIHSAPATTRPSRRSTRRLSTGISDDLQSTGSGSLHHSKSRRYQRKMGSAPGGRASKESPTKQQTAPVKLDIAALAQLGSLEMQDGKMRLVIDVDPGNF
jgi:hypothetical protein